MTTGGSETATSGNFLKKYQNMTVAIDKKRLKELQEDVFKDIKLSEVCGMDEKRRRDFAFKAFDSLLLSTDDGIDEHRAEYVGGLFWKTEEEVFEWAHNPTYEQYFGSDLSPEEKEQVEALCDVSCLAAGLVNIRRFVEPGYGLHDEDDFDFFIVMRDLARSLPYRRVAMYIAYRLRNAATGRMCSYCYLPAQDHLAEMWSVEFKTLIRQPYNTELSADDYTRTIINILEDVNTHIAKGYAMGLVDDEIIVHDCIYGFFVTEFDSEIVDVARRIVAFIKENMHVDIPTPALAEAYVETEEYAEQERVLMGRFVDFLHGVRDSEFAEGWITDDSLAFAYLYDFAKRCITELNIKQEMLLW